MLLLIFSNDSEYYGNDQCPDYLRDLAKINSYFLLISSLYFIFYNKNYNIL